MGLIELTNAIVPVTGEFTKKMLRMECVSCEHCQSVIAIFVQGCSRTYQSDRKCPRCDAIICKRCAVWMHEHQGQCPGPFKAKVEEALKQGNGHLLLTHIHRYRC